jgi:hypothetical protein
MMPSLIITKSMVATKITTITTIDPWVKTPSVSESEKTDHAD